MNLQEEIKHRESELVELIARYLEENTLDPEKAQALARDFLAILPIESQKELIEKLKTLGETQNEIKEIYVEELSKISDIDRAEKLKKMRDLIKNGKMEEAIATGRTLKQQ